jgi:flavoprotein
MPKGRKQVFLTIHNTHRKMGPAITNFRGFKYSFGLLYHFKSSKEQEFVNIIIGKATNKAITLYKVMNHFCEKSEQAIKTIMFSEENLNFWTRDGRLL